MRCNNYNCQVIVDHILGNGGRFVKKDGKTGQYYVLSKAEAKKKIQFTMLLF
jgi:hypothetical protein